MGTEALEIRVATRDDAAGVIRLLGEQVAERSGSRGADAFAALFDAHELVEHLGIEGPPWIVLALVEREAIAIATVEVRAGHEVRHATLRCLFSRVRSQPSYEAQLIDYVRQLAGSAGCSAVDIEVLPGDQRLKSMLEEIGFKARLLTMHQSLHDR